MASGVSETLVLRTYPFKEADLIVSFLTRDLGKLRGVARRARRPKSAFGSGLERLSRVQMAYFQRENADLASLTGCELIESQFGLQADYACGVTLDFLAEVADQLLPAHEPNEKFFRLLLAVIAYLRTGGEISAAVAYFSLWSVRLTGILPDLRLSRESGEIAQEMLHTALRDLSPREWTKGTASDLRRALVRTMEQHIERRLLTVPLLEAV